MEVGDETDIQVVVDIEGYDQETVFAQDDEEPVAQLPRPRSGIRTSVQSFMHRGA